MADDKVQDMQWVLRMSVAQSRRALEESGSALEELSDAFLDMASEVENLATLLEQNPNLSGDATNTLKQAIFNYRQHVQQGLISFQFYDKFSQRMHHLMTTLTELDQQIEDDALNDVERWQALWASIRNRYTMEQEHRLLDAIEAGATVDEAVAASAPPQDDDIELF